MTQEAVAETPTGEREPRWDASNAGKWGAHALEGGFTMVPNVLLAHQRTLDISPSELCVLLQLLRHWWFADRLPFPSVRGMEEALPMKRRAIQRALASLEEKGLVKREKRVSPTGRRSANLYDFSGLVEKVQALAAPMGAGKRRARLRAQVARVMASEAAP